MRIAGWVHLTEGPWDAILTEIDPDGGAAAPLGAVRRVNPIALDELLPPGTDAVPGARLVLPSGSLAEEPFESFPPNWLQPGRAALDALAARAGDAWSSAGRRLCFLPHHRQILSDAPSALRFLDDHAGGPFEVALAAHDLLDLAMLDDLDDHVERQFAMLGPRCAMVVLRDVEAVEGQGGEMEVRDLPLGLGRLDHDLLRRLLDLHVPRATPIVLGTDHFPLQVSWLETGRFPAGDDGADGPSDGLSPVARPV